MTGLKILVAAALLSTIAATQVLAGDEPAAFQSQNPNRDVLNGGQLTPEGRMALEQRGGNAMGSVAPSFQAPATDTVPRYTGRRHRSR
jgi:hypothetical protein